MLFYNSYAKNQMSMTGKSNRYRCNADWVTVNYLMLPLTFKFCREHLGDRVRDSCMPWRVPPPASSQQASGI